MTVTEHNVILSINVNKYEWKNIFDQDARKQYEKKEQNYRQSAKKLKKEQEF